MSELEAGFTGTPGEPSEYCLFLIRPLKVGSANQDDMNRLWDHQIGCEFCRHFLAGYFAEDDPGDA